MPRVEPTAAQQAVVMCNDSRARVGASDVAAHPVARPHAEPSNRPLQLTGPAPACGIQRFEGPAPQLNVMYVGRTSSNWAGRRMAVDPAQLPESLRALAPALTIQAARIPGQSRAANETDDEFAIRMRRVDVLLDLASEAVPHALRNALGSHGQDACTATFMSSSERSQHKNRSAALAKLEAAVLQLWGAE